jgi:RHS repeat-associated protein
VAATSSVFTLNTCNTPGHIWKQPRNRNNRCWAHTACQYDAFHNRSLETVTLSDGITPADNTRYQRHYQYNRLDQLLSIVPNPAGSSGDQPQINYHYDANGNLSQKIITQTISGHHTSNTLDYTFDVRGQLQQITTGGSTIGQFLYDANGQRIRARFNNNDGALLSDRYSLYQGLNLLSQYDISTSNTPLLNANYLINPQTSNPIGRTAWREKDSTNNTLAWYHTDALGSVLAIAKTNSSITARYDYDAWGNETHNTGTSDNPLGYTGHQMDRLSDDKTGLIYANARYLDPDTGRFLSFDPFEGYDNKPISLHRYLYAYQNPARYVDKDGRCAEPVTATLCAGAVIGTAFFLSETVAYLSSDPDGNGQSVASEIGTATAQLLDNVKTAAVDYYARQAVDSLSLFVAEGGVSPNTALVHDVPESGSYDHPADTDFNRPRIDTTPIVESLPERMETPIVESLPERMETPYHDKSPEEYILATPSRAGDIDSGLMLATGKSGSATKSVGSTRHVDLDKADNGAYMVLLDDGSAYIGKGGSTRARKSARRESRGQNSPVDDIAHWPEVDDTSAYSKEAELIESVGGLNAPGLLNRINSPGNK